MDVGKLFNLPKISSSSLNKRKWSQPTPEALKAARTEDSTSPQDTATATTSARPQPPRPTVTDQDDEDNNNDNDDFAPDNDADYFVDQDDDGGRFFGGGLTEQQKRILEIMNSGADDQGGGLDTKPEVEIANTRRRILRFERAITANQQMRVKFAHDPAKFIDSEADLDAELKGLVVLTTNPGLFYPELVKANGLGALCELLSHDNADIAASAIELIEELTDDDVLDAGAAAALGDEDDDERDSAERQGQEGMRVLVDALVEAQVLELLVSNLSRFKDGPIPTEADEASRTEIESDMQGVYHSLGAIENLVTFRPQLATRLVLQTDYLRWTLERIGRKGGYDQNKAYAVELLAIVLQGSEENRKRLGELEGVDTLLSVLSQYRKRSPPDADETEMLENLFDCLCSSLSVGDNKRRFLEGEGVELMVILMREKKVARLRSIKVLDYAMQGAEGARCCERFVEALGLRTLFAAFMGKASKKHASPTQEDVEHILSLLSSLFTHLPSDSSERIRLLSKFVEDGYAKTDRLLEIREGIQARLDLLHHHQKEEEEEEEEEEERYLKRLEGGLFALQLLDYIVAWLCMEDDGIQAHIKMLLSRKGMGLNDVIGVLQEYHDNIGDDPSTTSVNTSASASASASAGAEEGEVIRGGEGETSSLRFILAALLAFLRGGVEGAE